MTKLSTYNYKNDVKIPETIATSFKSLLETKHLYQNIRVDLSAFQIKRIKGNIGGGMPKGEDASKYVVFSLMPENIWTLKPSKESESHNYAVSLPRIEIFCAIDGKDEPFHPVESCTISHGKLKNVITQNFMISYKCQLCNTPATFMVRRDGLKLSLTGRSPMAAVQVPTCIPKKHKGYISDAIIARQSGQILPGLFMLRVFIEQYTISLSSISYPKADQYIEAYMSSLSPEFKKRVPSISDIYGKLSLAIHTAKDSSELFDATIDEIETHFVEIQLEEKRQKREK